MHPLPIACFIWLIFFFMAIYSERRILIEAMGVVGVALSIVGVACGMFPGFDKIVSNLF